MKQNIFKSYISGIRDKKHSWKPCFCFGEVLCSKCGQKYCSEISCSEYIKISASHNWRQIGDLYYICNNCDSWGYKVIKENTIVSCSNLPCQEIIIKKIIE